MKKPIYAMVNEFQGAWQRESLYTFHGFTKDMKHAILSYPYSPSHFYIGIANVVSIREYDPKKTYMSFGLRFPVLED